MLRNLVLSQYKVRVRFDDQDLINCPVDLLLAYQDYLAGFTAAPGKIRVNIEGPGDGDR